jgi:Cdc6-like AAA superfamily ATPase
MKTTHTDRSIKFIEWLSPNDMHGNSKEWLSELKFVEDEQLFFEDLITSFTLQLIDKQHFSENKKVIEALQSAIQEIETLVKTVTKHKNNLKIMVDEIDQLKEEERYKEEHKNLTVTIYQFLKGHKKLKTQLFDIIKDIKKTEKQKRLIE